MGEDKIDKLFQEKLKDFSEVPDPHVWQSIEASLDQKKKSKKLIPFWWQFGAAAAVLLIAALLFNPFTEKDPISVTDTNSTIEKTKEVKENTNTILKNNAPIQVEIDPLVSSEEATKIDQNSNDTQEQLVTNSNANSSKIQKSNSNTKASTQHLIATTNNTKQTEEKQEAINTPKHPLTNETTSGTAVASSEKTKDQHTNNASAEPNRTQPKNNNLRNPEKEEIALEDNTNKKSIFDEIEAQKEEAEEELITKNTESKWSAGPSIAPVYFNTIGTGSSVGADFVANSKSGEVTLSYGLSVAYEVNNKLSIRSGLHKVDYGYNTNDVEFSSSANVSSLNRINTIDYAQTAENLIVGSTGTDSYVPENSSATESTSSELPAESTSLSGVMQQQFSYLEVPIEVSYALIDKRFGLDLIGGVSSLFAVDNSVSLKSNELTTTLGESNNLQSLNFSTNIGLGLNYNFSPKMKFNVEPVFKYQMNTYSSSAGNFQPFSIGIYSGLSFKF